MCWQGNHNDTNNANFNANLQIANNDANNTNRILIHESQIIY